MRKKVFTMFLSFMLLIGFVSMTYAKKETKEEKKAVTQEEKKTINKKVVEEKDPLKEKTSVAIDIFNSVHQ